jgi:quercetin dioxygenase-like cupin family protein
LFYVLEGEYEFTFERDGDLATISGTPGTAVAVPPNVPHTFKNGTDAPARLLFVHQPAALEEFFEEFGVPVDAERDSEAPDFGAMAAALERNGVHVVGAPA